ncbi:hypothetical protein PAHAL_4G136000 [Panicum hallii]|uniref:F-box domain-containing protein n=1 Tax=Panicum hallii TaxID=206008 RepID=A0A2T8JCU0_9POAL|nr:hypothetical protein PAHAL_4G136000 [Panicum hallii]
MEAPGEKAALGPVLSEAVIGEVLFRLPPDQPACLFRAAAVCQAWRTFFTSPDMLRIYRKHHMAPPVLGFLQNTGRSDDPFPRFVTTAAPSPPLHHQPEFECVYSLALDCRHGRVLLHTTFPLGLIVWSPVTGDHQLLPEEPIQLDPPQPPYSDFAGAVLCAGPFHVLFAATSYEDVDVVSTWAILYSSETGAWTEPSTVHPGAVMNSPDVMSIMGPSLLVGDALYFTLGVLNNRTVLTYNLVGGALTVMDPPPLVRRDAFLVTGEGGGLGVAAVEGYSLRLWSWEAAGRWALCRVIDLEMSIPFTIGAPITQLKVIGFAEMSDTIFVSANGIISSVQLRSGRVRKFSKTPNSDTIFPFEIFYTLGTSLMPTYVSVLS